MERVLFIADHCLIALRQLNRKILKDMENNAATYATILSVQDNGAKFFFLFCFCFFCFCFFFVVVFVCFFFLNTKTINEF